MIRIDDSLQVTLVHTVEVLKYPGQPATFFNIF
jgi:hypothetical protein